MVFLISGNISSRCLCRCYWLFRQFFRENTGSQMLAPFSPSPFQPILVLNMNGFPKKLPISFSPFLSLCKLWWKVPSNIDHYSHSPSSLLGLSWNQRFGSWKLKAESSIPFSILATCSKHRNLFSNIKSSRDFKRRSLKNFVRVALENQEVII